MTIFTAIALCSFAFSTVLGWGLYGARFVEYLCSSHKAVKPFMVVFSLAAILGATMDLGLIWDLSDTFNGLMSLPNLVGLSPAERYAVQAAAGAGQSGRDLAAGRS